ncbi:MAG: hypothetical protein R3B60_00615 [Candidatus Paceibacterota bacterium]
MEMLMNILYFVMPAVGIGVGYLSARLLHTKYVYNGILKRRVVPVFVFSFVSTTLAFISAYFGSFLSDLDGCGQLCGLAFSSVIFITIIVFLVTVIFGLFAFKGTQSKFVPVKYLFKLLALYTGVLISILLYMLPDIIAKNERIENMREAHISSLTSVATENEYVCGAHEGKKHHSFISIEDVVYYKTYWDYEKDVTGASEYVYSEEGKLNFKFCKIDGSNCYVFDGQPVNLYSKCYNSKHEIFGEKYKVK